MVNIGYAHDGLIGSVQEQLRRAQKEIGFTYLRFHGIFDDDMHIYQENEDGSPWFNFAYADLLFDFIQEIGLIPYVELGYMPSKLAKTQYTVFDNPAICISMYNDSEKWQALVQACLSHWIDKYGLANVRKWRFTVFSMNYSRLQYTAPVMSHEDYCKMFEATYQTIKMIDPELKLGGAGCFPGIALAPDGLRRFLLDVKEHGCPPDFITVQCYPHEDFSQDSDFFYFTSKQISMPSVLSKDKNFTLHFLQRLNRIRQEIGFADCPVVVEEWNSTLWQRDLSGDTCYKAAWLIKNILQNYDQAEYLGYWLTLLTNGWYRAAYFMADTVCLLSTEYPRLAIRPCGCWVESVSAKSLPVRDGLSPEPKTRFKSICTITAIMMRCTATAIRS